MLLSFTVENFKSFRNASVFEMKASSKKPAYSWLQNNVTLLSEEERIVKVKAIYGANASGKSSLIRAIAIWQEIAVLSARKNFDTLPVEPFSLDVDFLGTPTTLVGTFLVEGRKFEYGLKLTQTEILEEWLYDRTVRRATIFRRVKRQVNANLKYFNEDARLSLLLNKENDIFTPRASFLAAAQLLQIGELSGLAADGISNIKVLTEKTFSQSTEFPAQLLTEDSELRRETSEMLKLMDIEHGELLALDKEKLVTNKLMPGIEKFGEQTNKRFFTITTRSVKGREGESLAWLSDTHESAGTRKVLQLAPLIILTLRSGGTLIIDEFEAQLHTRISREIVQLFNSISGNPHNAQFIFSTHDTNLLDNKLLRRDQISLVEKDDTGASELYDLSDIKGVISTANFESEYLGGSYGAVPDVRDLDLALDLESPPNE